MIRKKKGTVPTTVKGEDGEDTITTTYTVDTNTGKITASEGKPVRTKEPTNTVVKVAAKDKVEKTEISSPKKYVKDDTRDKNQPNVEEAGQAGSSTITTTYSVDSTTGAITETVEKPVVVNPTATIVKVAAKDKIVETPIEPEVEYVRDGEREVDTPNERIEGAKGKTVTTTTYDVDSKDGHITEHVANNITTPAKVTPGKVTPATPVTPATNGNSGQDTPAPAPTTPIPDAVTPNANHEDTTDASDNGTKSNDSQNVLPNTGTESNATLASLGLLGMLSGLGFAFRKKKED